MPDKTLTNSDPFPATAIASERISEKTSKPANEVRIPDYLQEVYWWAYLHPAGIRLFDHPWLVNLILWGNFNRLRDGAIGALGRLFSGRILQMACVYGDLTPSLAASLAADSELHVIDVASIQLANLRAKLPAHARIRLGHQDASALDYPDATFAATLIFFLLHEQPEDVRRRTLAEALRVTRPGGRIVIVDYHRPQASNPLRYLMPPVLKLLEPFALDLWRQEITDYLPNGCALAGCEKTTAFGALYQQLVITVGDRP